MYEISSDSDDDYYDKFPQKLQRLKNRHALNNILKAVDNSLDVIPVETNGITTISRQDSDVIQVLDGSIDHSPNCISIDLDTPTEQVTSRSRGRKRKTSDIQSSPRTSTRKGGKRGRGRGTLTSVTTAPQFRGRGRRGRSAKNSTDDDFMPVNVPTPPRRGRGRRGRSAQNDTDYDFMPVNIPTPPRRGRGQRRSSRVPRNQSIITYSVGNTAEYPDASDGLVLFSNKNITTDPPEIIDLDESLDNEELSVKVFWQHSEVFKFNIRRLQKLTQIFDFFVNKEGVSKDRLLLTYNTNKIIRPDDTPDSIAYNIAKFIEGGIVNQEFSLHPSNTPQKKGFMVKFQIQNRKRPFEVSVCKDEKLQLAMVKCAEHLEIPITDLVFEFDGETIRGNTTPNDLDMDSGDCVDVKIVNVNK